MDNLTESFGELVFSDRAMAEASPLIHRAWSRLEAMEGEIARN